MKKVRKIFKNNYKILIGLILGVIISVGGVCAATTIAGSTVTYSNSSSGLSSTTVQGAIDELYTKTDIRKTGNFISAYDYQTDGFYKCITGEEDTCQRTYCYKKNYGRTCRKGTIIKYKVNDTDIVTFHVMYDNGSTLTMQSQKNTVYNTKWYSDNINTSGPLIILPALEHATNGWTNVNYIEYTAGTTNLYQNAYTGCSSYNSCETNRYTLSSRKARARMITTLEAVNLGCTNQPKSCPIWMYNYLFNSVSNGATVDDSTIDPTTGQHNDGYFTMSAGTITSSSGDNNFVLAIYGTGLVSFHYPMATDYGARAVVEVTKLGY